MFPLKLITKFICALFIFTTVIMSIILAIFIFIPLKLVVLGCARIFRKDLEHSLTGLSALQAYDNIWTKPESNLCVCAVFSGPICISEFCDIFQKRVIEKTYRKNGPRNRRGEHENGKLLVYPELKQYWTDFLGYKFWKREANFDLKSHVRLYQDQDQNQYQYQTDGKVKTVDDDGDGDNSTQQHMFSENDLRCITGHLLAKPWTPGKSPWEVLLVDNFWPNYDSPEPSTVLIFRLHHSLGDGYSILKLAVGDLMNSPLEININFPKRNNSWLKSALSRILLPFKVSWDLAESVLISIDPPNHWRGSGPPKSGNVSVGFSKPIPVEFIKSIKNKHGVGYSSVMYAVAAVCCQRLMEEAGQDVPTEMSSFTPAPLAKHPGGLTNHVTWDYLKLPLRTKRSLSRIERLRFISKQTSHMNNSTAALGWSLFGKYCSFLPSCILARLRNGHFSLCMTSFSCHQDIIIFDGLNDGGVQLVDILASVGPGWGTLGTIICLTSCNGKQRLAICIDKAIFPRDDIIQNKWGKFVEEEFAALWDIKTGVIDSKKD